MRNTAKRLTLGLIGVSLLLACSTEASPAGSPGEASAGMTPEAVTLRLGYFPNVTHATALAGDQAGIFEDAVGDNVTLAISNFNAGNEAVEAIFNGGLDITYIGPNPAINAHIRSAGAAIRIIAGATSGGAFLVVDDDIETAEDLRGRTVASPALGNTQDVALRAWLSDNGLQTDAEGGGDVSITPLANADILEGFSSGSLDGAWVPEPWASRMVQAGGRILVDEADLWPDGQYVTTHVIVRTEFLRQHPEIVKRFLQGHVEASAFVNAQTEEAQRYVSQGIEAITGSTMAPEVLAAAWPNLTFTVDPIASSLRESAEDAAALGFLPSSDLEGIYDLTLLNEVLREAGQPEVPQP